VITLNQALEDIKTRILPILQEYDVVKAAVFGSLVRGEATDSSDLDLLIEFSGKKSLFDLVNLKLALEEKLQCKVDVLTYNSIHPLIKDTILNEEVVIYG
jgi:predicted nucleotidyltransferase